MWRLFHPRGNGERLAGGAATVAWRVLMGAVVGVGAGWLGDFFRRMQRQSQDLLRERAALRAEIARRERVEFELQQAKLLGRGCKPREELVSGEYEPRAAHPAYRDHRL